MESKSFSCKRCGKCCEGVGGIVLTAKDRKRLAAFLGLSENEMLARFAERAGGKLRLGTGADGFCVFYKSGTGCAVHPARPDVCRAWPYFRGNLVDRTSWEMIQSDCPGVNAAAGHETFVREGLAYLRENGLTQDPGPEAPAALVLDPSLRDRGKP